MGPEWISIDVSVEMIEANAAFFLRIPFWLLMMLPVATVMYLGHRENVQDPCVT